MVGPGTDGLGANSDYILRVRAVPLTFPPGKTPLLVPCPGVRPLYHPRAQGRSLALYLAEVGHFAGSSDPLKA